jgi:hypothetical protein
MTAGGTSILMSDTPIVIIDKEAGLGHEKNQSNRFFGCTL